MRHGWLWRRNSRSQALALTWRERLLLYGGIFFTFSAMGWIIAIASWPIWGFGGGLYSACISGVSACMWAYCFIAGRLWLLPIVLVWQIFGPRLVANHILASTGLFSLGMQQSERDKVVTLALMGTFFLIIGYVLSSIYIGRIAGRTMKAQAELEVARKVHETLVPDLSMRAKSIEVFGRSLPSTEMGGDLIDAVVRENEVDAYLVDVSGHGVGAGIVMAMVKSSIRTQLHAGGGRAPLDRLLEGLNTVLAALVHPGTFATMACVRVSPQVCTPDGVVARVEYALAGHLPILLHQGGRVIDLPNEHLPLAVDECERFRTGQVTLHAGDTLVLLTDGLVEVMDRSGKQLGLDRLRGLVAEHGPEPLANLHERLIGAARAHGAQADDQSVLLVRVNALASEPKPV